MYQNLLLRLHGLHLFFITLAIFATSLCFASHILAVNYGDGNYGADVYSATSSSATVPPTSNSSGSTSNSSQGGLSAPLPPNCDVVKPGSPAPTLYAAIPKSRSEIQLYFTDASKPFDHYTLEYGAVAGNYPFGVTSLGSVGTRTFTVASLETGKKYYFRLRAGNGCATGDWSNEISGQTKRWFDSQSVDIKDVSVVSDTSIPQGDIPINDASNTKAATSSAATSPIQNKTGYTVGVSVVDKTNKPVAGASVTLHSVPKNAITDAKGEATFEDVEAGEHTLLVSNGKYSGEQKLQINGDVKQIHIVVELHENPLSINRIPLIAITIGVSLLVLIAVIFAIRKKLFR